MELAVAETVVPPVAVPPLAIAPPKFNAPPDGKEIATVPAPPVPLAAATADAAPPDGKLFASALGLLERDEEQLTIMPTSPDDTQQAKRG